MYVHTCINIHTYQALPDFEWGLTGCEVSGGDLVEGGRGGGGGGVVAAR